MVGKSTNNARRSRTAALLLTAGAALLLAACSGASATKPAAQTTATGTASGTPLAAAASASATPHINIPAGIGSGTPAAATGVPTANNAVGGKYAGLEPQLDAQQLYADLQKKKLPVSDGTAVTADTDPDGQLGKPGGYTSRVDFLDTSLAQPGTAWSLANGGAIEVFASDQDARKAMKALDAANQSNPTEHDTLAKTVILRLSLNVAADQQSSYGLAVKRAVADDLKRQYKAASTPSATPSPTPTAGQ